MVAGHLAVKNDLFYMVLNLKDENGKRKPKWVPTYLPVKGNKKRADAMLLEERKKYVNPPKGMPADGLTSSMYFEDYMAAWIKLFRTQWAPTTYTGYKQVLTGSIYPYFSGRKIRLMDLQPEHIQEFYRYCMEDRRLSGSTTLHYHANIHKALKYAVRLKKIPANPADAVERPKKEHPKHVFYTAAEIQTLLEVIHGDWVEFGVIMAAYYGLRREEVIGLRWSSIDFENNRLTINHTVTSAKPDGKRILVAADRTKNKSSARTMPLTPGIREMLLSMKARQNEYRIICGNCYNHEYDDYIYVNEMGNLIKPDTLSNRFALLIKKNGLKKITYHELRHSCASLLLAVGNSMKAIQEWLGHSDYATTANIYAHLDERPKQDCADSMAENIDIENNGVVKPCLMGEEKIA